MCVTTFFEKGGYNHTFQKMLTRNVSNPSGAQLKYRIQNVGVYTLQTINASDSVPVRVLSFG